jgi:hypothetical protein
MDIKTILSELRSERQRLDQAISALEGLDGAGVRPRTPQAVAQRPQKARKRGAMSAAGRKRISEMMKARWAARRRAAKKG